MMNRILAVDPATSQALQARVISASLSSTATSRLAELERDVENHLRENETAMATSSALSANGKRLMQLVEKASATTTAREQVLIVEQLEREYRRLRE